MIKKGFTISVYAEVPFARSMVLSPSGVLYVASYSFAGIDGDSRQLTHVWAVADYDKDGHADLCVPVTEPLWVPNGIGFFDGNLYVALIDRILMYPNVEADLTVLTQPVVIVAPGVLPTSTWHGWRYLRIGPRDHKIYLVVSSPCNVPGDQDPECADSRLHPLYGTIQQMNLDGSQMTTIARGIRNSVGVTFHPTTGDLWFTDNGRDNWNDPKSPVAHNQRPPDELNVLPLSRMSSKPHYGFPYCYGYDLVDSNFNSWGNCRNSTPAAMELLPHAAALGVRFYTGQQFPSSYQYSAFIAEHGSWDKQPPNGYRVTQVTFDENGHPLAYQPFIEGWIDNSKECVTDDDCPFTAFCQNATRSSGGEIYIAPFYCAGWGRPSDVEVHPFTGALLISDEQNGVVYKVEWVGVAVWDSIYFQIGVPVGAGIVALIITTVCFVRWFRKRPEFSPLDSSVNDATT